ncbi:hypothetical protein [Saccharopolyspora spinosa]|uniref:hypothetical protein n=1 Tax=Saccharopolyspora spinosa TaxID=60894 RepID=UPI0002DDAD02|nr:hypothetical protein [Saccharopolyspora spinosa]
MFDDPNLVADAGLVPVVRLAERARLGELVIAAVRLCEGKAADVRGRSPVRRRVLGRRRPSRMRRNADRAGGFEVLHR